MNLLSLADTMSALRAKGYTEDFNLPNDLLEQHSEILHADGDEFVIDQVFRFDVMGESGKQSVLYAIHSLKSGKKGLQTASLERMTKQKAAAIHRWESEGGQV